MTGSRHERSHGGGANELDLASIGDKTQDTSCDTGHGTRRNEPESDRERAKAVSDGEVDLRSSDGGSLRCILRLSSVSSRQNR